MLAPLARGVGLDGAETPPAGLPRRWRPGSPSCVTSYSVADRHACARWHAAACPRHAHALSVSASGSPQGQGGRRHRDVWGRGGTRPPLGRTRSGASLACH